MLSEIYPKYPDKFQYNISVKYNDNILNHIVNIIKSLPPRKIIVTLYWIQGVNNIQIIILKTWVLLSKNTNSILREENFQYSKKVSILYL